MNLETTSPTKRPETSKHWWPLLVLLLLLPFVWCGGLRQRDGVRSVALVQQPVPAVVGSAAPATPCLATPPKGPGESTEAFLPLTPIEKNPAAKRARVVPESLSRQAMAPRPASSSRTGSDPVVLKSPEPSPNAIAPPPPQHEPISFEATTIDGAAFSLQKLRGKVVLIDLISVHCGYCFDELDSLQDLKRRYPEVVVVAVAAGETVEEIRTSLDARELPFPFPVIADPQSRLLEVLPSYGTPTHVVLDREGRFSSERVVIGVNQPAVLERVVRVASGLPARKVVTARESKPLE